VDGRTEKEPGWFLRIAGFPLVFLAILYVVLTYLYLSGHFFRMSFTQGPIQGLAATAMAATMMLVVYAALVRALERREASELASPPMVRELGIGLLLGFGLYTTCILILMLLGFYRVDGINAWAILLPGLAAPLATGVFEELLFRGGVFRVVEKWCGSWIALVVSSLVFGFVHLENEGATMQGILSISIWAGILLAATYMLTRRLWLGIGLHAAWNYTQGTVWSGIVSGSDAPVPGLVRSSMQGPDWLTGGAFGVEASVVALLVCTGVGLAMLVVAARRGNVVPPPWMHRR
jgi:membrane protease YdiL (CAAX protease family)